MMHGTYNVKLTLVCMTVISFQVIHIFMQKGNSVTRVVTPSIFGKTKDFLLFLTYVCVKAIPLQAWAGPEGSRRLRLPDFKIIGTLSW